MARPGAAQPGDGMLAAQLRQALALPSTIVGGAGSTPADMPSARADRRMADQLNAIVLRRRVQQRRGPLTLRGARVAVAGSTSVARPPVRSGMGG